MFMIGLNYSVLNQNEDYLGCTLEIYCKEYFKLNRIAPESVDNIWFFLDPNLLFVRIFQMIID